MLIVAVVVSLLAGFVPLAGLADLVSIGTLVAFTVVSVAVILLRRREPDLPRSFKVPGYPVTPILTIVACGYVMSGLHGITWLIFGTWILVVIVFYLVWGRRNAALNREPTGEAGDSVVSR